MSCKHQVGGSNPSVGSEKKYCAVEEFGRPRHSHKLEIVSSNLTRAQKIFTNGSYCSATFLYLYNMKRSNNYKVLICAFKKGYVVNKKGEVFFKNKKRSLIFDTKGYYSFTIRIYSQEMGKDVFRRVWVHRLQAYQKFGKRIFKSGIEVRHLNGNCRDNSFENILIGTASQNQMDKLAGVRTNMAIMAASSMRRFTDDQVKEINDDRKNGMSYNALAKKYQTSKSTLSYFFNKAHYNECKNVL